MAIGLLNMMAGFLGGNATVEPSSSWGMGFLDGMHSSDAVTPPTAFGGSVAWQYWELPIHAFSAFFVPLLVYAINCYVFDEMMPPEKHTRNTAIWQHFRHAIDCSLSLWVWQSLLLNPLREEPDLTTLQCVRTSGEG